MEIEAATAVEVTVNKATGDTVGSEAVATANKETGDLAATVAMEVLALEDSREDSAVPVALVVSEALQVAEEVDLCVVVEGVAAEPADLPRTKITAI